MDLLRPSVLKELCARTGIRPDRRSGQNFLVNRATLDRIVAAVDPQPGDTILEVGAGFGVLTLALAERMRVLDLRAQRVDEPSGGRALPAAKARSEQASFAEGGGPRGNREVPPAIIAIERDRRMTPILRNIVTQYGNVEVVEGDIIALLGRGVPMRRSMGSATPKRTCGAMSNDETRMTNQCPNDERTKRIIRISDLIRHSSFGFRHSDHDTRLAVGQRWKLAANLPYGITSDFLRLLFDAVGTVPDLRAQRARRRREEGLRPTLDDERASDLEGGGRGRETPGGVSLLSLPPPERAVLLLQREVVDRMCADPSRASDRRAVGILTILAQLHCTPRRIVRVPPSHFWPAPKVESAVVVLENWRTPEEIEVLLGGPTRDEFLHVVRTCFAHRRRQIGRLLKGHASSLMTARPETLTLEQWVALVRALKEKT